MNTDTGDSELLDAINRGELKPSAQVFALLQELHTLLTTLVTQGQASRLDIRSLPMLPAEHDFLRDFLGEGEVTATLNALGQSTIKETRFPGIWWITHYNAHAEIVAELIEVTLLPDILKTQAPDLHHGLDALHLQLLKLQTAG